MRTLIRGLTIPVVVLAVWEFGGRLGFVPAETFSRPSEILSAGWNSLVSGELLLGTIQTLVAAASGLLIALAIGVPVGLALGTSRLVKSMIGPTLDAFKSVPPVALIPLSLLIYGFGLWMEASVVAFACVWSLIIATTAAVQAIEPRLAEVASALEMKPRTYVRKIILPAAIGRIAVGLRVSIGIALVVAVTVEIVVNPRGLGYLLITAQQSMRPDLMYALLFWVGLVGWLINSLLVSCDRRFLSRFTPQGRPA